MSKKWYIYGAGGLGIETMDVLIDRLAHMREDGVSCEFMDDQLKTDTKCGFPVVGFSDAVPGSQVTIAVGEPSIRKS